MAALLLDTSAAVAVAEDDLTPEGEAAIDRAYRARAIVYLSPVTAWEIALLMQRGRLASPLSPERWFERLAAAPGVQIAELTSAVMVAAAGLPGTPPRDPADRMIVATARQLGLTLMTRDKLLLGYAQAGHVQAVGC
jgi:PIN domain nuclease of toxin-antitoxin system